MLYRIADLIVEMAPVGDMPGRMRAYETPEGEPEIRLTETDYRLDSWLRRLNNIDLAYYMETGRVFCNKLLRYDGMMLHASRDRAGWENRPIPDCTCRPSAGTR